MPRVLVVLLGIALIFAAMPAAHAGSWSAPADLGTHRTFEVVLGDDGSAVAFGAIQRTAGGYVVGDVLLASRRPPGGVFGAWVQISPEGEAARFETARIDGSGKVVVVWYATKDHQPRVRVGRWQPLLGWHNQIVPGTKASLNSVPDYAVAADVNNRGEVAIGFTPPWGSDGVVVWRHLGGWSAVESGWGSAPAELVDINAVTIDDEGQVAVTWHDADLRGSCWARIRRGPGIWGSRVRLNPDGRTCHTPVVADNRAGDIALTWTEERYVTGYGNRAYLMHREIRSGVAWSARTALASNLYPGTRSETVLDDQRRTTVTYPVFDGKTTTWWWRSRSAAGEWTAPARLPIGVASRTPVLVVDGQGVAQLAWGGPTWSPRVLWTRKAPTGSWQTPTVLTQDGSFPALAGNARGDSIVVWRTAGGDRVRSRTNG